MEGWLRQQAAWSDLRGRILILPGKPLQDLPVVMNALDVMVLPSRTVPTWKEQFGRVIIEANACGVPVIGSNSGAIPEVVQDAGIVYTEGCVPKLTKALEEMHKNKQLRRQMGKAGLRQVHDMYTWQRVAEKMAEIYRQVAAR